MEEAPPQQDPVTETIYVTGHKIFGMFGPIHTALQYRGTFSFGLTDMISAAPGPNKVLGPYLNKKAQGVAEVDEYANMLLGTVSNTNWLLLFDGDNAYVNNDLVYSPFAFGNFYNSNSYVAGLIEAKGGIADIDLTQFIGGGHPVPQDKF